MLLTDSTIELGAVTFELNNKTWRCSKRKKTSFEVIGNLFGMGKRVTFWKFYFLIMESSCVEINCVAKSKFAHKTMFKIMTVSQLRFTLRIIVVAFFFGEFFF